MKKLQERGFTLIELLVVIAIIGILAGILFVAINPTNQIKKAKVSKIKSSLAGVPAAATVHYSDHDYSYAAFCTDPSLTSIAGEDWNGTAAGLGYACADTDTGWAVQITDGTDYYCIDSTGSGLKDGTSSMITNGGTDTTC